MRDLDALLINVTSFNGRSGIVKALPGDYQASKIGYRFPTKRSDYSTRTEALSALRQLLNAHPTDSLTAFRGYHDDFSSNLYQSGGGIALAADGGGPASGALLLSKGLVRFAADGTGVLIWRGASAGAFGSWAISSGSATTGGGVLYVPFISSFAASSKYAIRMCAKITLANTIQPVFVGLCNASGTGTVAGVLSNTVAGITFPGTTSTINGVAYHDITMSGPSDFLTVLVPASVKTFQICVTYNPTRGSHVKLLTGSEATDAEFADVSTAANPLAFVLATKGAPSINYEMLSVDYVNYQLAELG